MNAGRKTLYRLTMVLGFLSLLGNPALGQQANTNKDLVNRFVKAVNQRTYDDFNAIVQPDFVRHCQATPDVEVTSLDDFVAFLRQDLETFPDGRVELTQVVAESDRVAYWGTYRGTQKGPMGPFAATGNQVELDMAGVFRIQEGKIAELWITWDNLTVFSQLGINPLGAPEDEQSPVVKE